MTGTGGGVGIASRYREVAHMAASLTLLEITGVDLIHLKARLFLERPGFNVDSSPGKADLSVAPPDFRVWTNADPR